MNVRYCFLCAVILWGSCWGLFAQCPPPLPIAFDDVSCVPQSFTLSAINSPDTYNWYDVPTGGTPIFQGDFFSTPVLSATTTYYVTSFDSGFSCESARVAVTALLLPTGDTAVFGTNAWNVYCFNSTNWTNYRGFYTDNNLNIDTEVIWDELTGPASAIGYNGCPVNDDNHSVRYKREGFPTGVYQIEIRNHNDDFVLLINQKAVLSRVGFGQTYTTAWVGPLDATSKVEYRWLDNADISSAEVRFNLISMPTDLYGGTLSGNSAYCLNQSPSRVGDTVVVECAQDAFVQSGSGTAITHGVANPAELRVNNFAPNDIYDAYLRFDLSSLALSNVNNVYLYLRGKTAAAYPNKLIGVYSVADVLWTEDNITGSNKPTFSASPISTTVVYDINEQWYQWDVSSYVLSQLALGEKEVSLVLRAETTEDRVVNFYSAETSLSPHLVINQRQGGCSMYTYAWQGSTACDGNWLDIPGETNVLYTLSTPNARACYRLKITDGCGNIAYSDPVAPPTAAGTTSVYPIDPNQGQVQLAGYTGNVVQWESSTDDFASMPSINLTSAAQVNYNGSSSTNIYYRALVQSGLCPALYSDTALINKISEFIIFNSFSPDQDGINDTWQINGIERYPNNRVLVLNAAGAKVVEKQNYDNVGVVWDGTSDKGLVLPDGAYYYSVEIPGQSAYTGYVIIKR
jgi:gliding motility-associated-like protein